MRSYKDAIAYLDSFTNFEVSGFEKFKGSAGLSRLVGVLEEMRRPDKAYKSIHIAGTKGKGSVSTFTASILRSYGHKVGLYTSPHLNNIRERININGVNISEEAFSEAVSELKPFIDKNMGDFTYFEILTLIAIEVFGKEKADYAVFETGLGGRLDATNIIDPEVSGITPVSFDHTDVLGETIESITDEKAGIIKKNSICVISRQNERALAVIESKCAALGSELLREGKDFSFEIIDEGSWGSKFNVITKNRKYVDCRTIMPGRFQVENAAQAVCICEQVLKGDAAPDKVRDGIRDSFIPGRLEVISKDPLIVIDGAQNGESTKKLKDSVEDIFKYDRLILLLGLSRDKDVLSISGNLAPMADSIILTRAASARAMDPYIIKGYFKGQRAEVTSNVKEALGMAFIKARANDLILATGSFYVIGEVREQVLAGRLGG